MAWQSEETLLGFYSKHSMQLHLIAMFIMYNIFSETKISTYQNGL